MRILSRSFDTTRFAVAAVAVTFVGMIGAAVGDFIRRDLAVNREPLEVKVALLDNRQAYLSCPEGFFTTLPSRPELRRQYISDIERGRCRLGPGYWPPHRVTAVCEPLCARQEGVYNPRYAPGS